ncbi:MAG: pyruvate dehydrogenase (acetyl-transferring) E1 component subunit alpha [Pseudomonadota bacterium]
MPAKKSAAKRAARKTATKPLARKTASVKKASVKKASPKPTSKKDALEWFRQMLLIRRFEERAGQLYGMGLIGGFCHLVIGQEAVVVGLLSLLEKGDSVITGYRSHGHMLSCGMDPKGVMAELTGRRDGYSKGKGGSMHMFSIQKNFYGGHGIVAAQVPLGAGLAFAHKYRKKPFVSLTCFGDGAANQGQIYETYNMASLWKLPIVFVIENNRYGMGTSVDRHAAGKGLARRGDGFAIPNEMVDGMDILKVREAGARALAFARSGKGPYILEIETYRYRGHSMSDPAKYRSRSEVQEMRAKRDPIEQFRAYIQKKKIASTDALKKIDEAIRAQVTQAAEFAQQSPEPDLSELVTDILVDAS